MPKTKSNNHNRKLNCHEESPNPKTNDRTSRYKLATTSTSMKNLLIRRRMLERVGTQSQEILRCAQDDVAGLIIHPGLFHCINPDYAIEFSNA